MYIYDTPSPSSNYNEKCFRQNLYWKSKTVSCSISLFIENRAIYEIISKNIADPDRPQMAIWRMYFETWITEIADTNWEYVILIVFHSKNCLAKITQSYITRIFTPLLNNKTNTLKTYSQKILKKSHICHIPGLIKYLEFGAKELFGISHCPSQRLFHGLRNAVTVFPWKL